MKVLCAANVKGHPARSRWVSVNGGAMSLPIGILRWTLAQGVALHCSLFSRAGVSAYEVAPRYTCIRRLTSCVESGGIRGIAEALGNERRYSQSSNSSPRRNILWKPGKTVRTHNALQTDQAAELIIVNKCFRR